MSAAVFTSTQDRAWVKAEIDYIWYLLGAFGIFVIPYLRKTGFRIPGFILGFASISSSIAGLIMSYLGIEGAYFQAIWVALSFVLVITAYVILKTLAASIFLVLPFYLLVLIFAPSFSTLALFAGFEVGLGMLAAYDFSRIDFTKIKGRTKSESVLAPFSRLSFFAKHLLHERWSKTLMFLIYALIPIALFGLAVVIWSVSGTTIVPDVLLVAGSIYFAIAKREFETRRHE